jgi:hypothetical protein
VTGGERELTPYLVEVFDKVCANNNVEPDYEAIKGDLSHAEAERVFGLHLRDTSIAQAGLLREVFEVYDRVSDGLLRPMPAQREGEFLVVRYANRQEVTVSRVRQSLVRIGLWGMIHTVDPPSRPRTDYSLRLG